MTSGPITAQIVGLRQRRQARKSSNPPELAEDGTQLPDFVRQSPVAMRYLRLLDSSVELIGQELAAEGVCLGESISLDTKHILAWVNENTPKAYLPNGRYDKKR